MSFSITRWQHHSRKRSPKIRGCRAKEYQVHSGKTSVVEEAPTRRKVAGMWSEGDGMWVIKEPCCFPSISGNIECNKQTQQKKQNLCHHVMVKNSATDLSRPKRSIFMVFFLSFSTNSVHWIFIDSVDNMNNRVLLICSRMRKPFRGRIPTKMMKLNYEASSSTLDSILYSHSFFP